MCLLLLGLQFLNIIDLDGTMQLSQLGDVFSDPIYFRDGIPVGTSVETTAYVSKLLFSGIFLSRIAITSSYFRLETMDFYRSDKATSSTNRDYFPLISMQ